MIRRKASKPKLTAEDTDAITGILEGWQGKLTWAALIGRVEAILGRRYTRQGLERHAQVKQAFQSRKTRLRAAKDTLPSQRSRHVNEDVTPELAAERRRRLALEERVARLERTISAYDERFVLWLYNARLKGLTQDRLNAQLPPSMRQRSDGQ